MTLAVLIQKGGLERLASANPAKAANDGPDEAGTLARLATLALANPQKAGKDDADTLPDPAAEARQVRVLAMLEAHPEARYAALTDMQADPEAVLLTLVIRGHAMSEFRIPREKWDGVLFLELLERHGGTVH